MPVVRGATRPARGCRGPRLSARQLCGGGEGAALARPHLRRGAWLAATAAAVLGRQLLQPGLPRRDRGRSAEADAQRLPSRRRDGPALLELLALLRAHRARPGSAPRRHSGTGMEHVRLHAGGAPDRLGRAAELLVTSTPPRRAAPVAPR